MAEGFPKHMYNGKFAKPSWHQGDPEPIFKVVNDKDEEKAALASGWKDKPPVRPISEAPAAAKQEAKE